MEYTNGGKDIKNSQNKLKEYTSEMKKHDVMISYDISEANKSLYPEIYKMIEKRHKATPITESNYKFDKKYTIDGISKLKAELSEVLKAEMPLNENFYGKQTKVILVYADCVKDNYALIEETVIDETLIKKK